MNDFDDLDDLLGPLRSAATDTELAGETSHVDAMARHHRRQKGHTMFTSRRARVAAFVAAGVIGFGGVAAAGPGGPLSRSGGGGTTTTTTTTTEVTTTTSEVPTTTSEVTTTTSQVQQEPDALFTQSVIEELPADEPETDECADGGDYANHGEYVSAVAHADDGELAKIEQRDAAQSSCGKDAKDAKGLDDDDEDELEKSEADEVENDDDSDDDDSDDDDSDDDEKDERSEKAERSGKSESAGKRGNGSKKHSDD